MRYFNFDPNRTDVTPISETLGKLSPQKVATENLDITRLAENACDQDITEDILEQYVNVAKRINHDSIKKLKRGKKHQSGYLTIKEYDEYLREKYPLAESKTTEKFIKLQRQRAKELMQETKKDE